jgi:hypothetical protein
MADLDILDVRLGPPARAETRGVLNLEPGEEPTFIDVTITVRNNTSISLYAVSSIRRIEYDANTRTLRLSLKEPAPAENPEFIISRPVILPKFTLVPAGSTENIQVTVPQVINRITSFAPTEQGDLEHEAINIGDMQQVECTVAYSDTPFEPEQDARPDDILAQLSSWGEETRIAVQPKGRSRGTNRPRRRS